MTTLHTVTGAFSDLAGARAAGSGSVVAGGQVDGAWRTIGQYVDTEGHVIRLPAVDVTLDSSGRLTTAAAAPLQLPETSGEWGYLLTLHVQGVERRYYFELTDDVDLADVAESTPIDMDLLPTWEALSARIGALEEIPPGSYDDTEVRGLVTAEATTRAAADTALGVRIDQEAAARAAAISTAINALIGMAPAELDTLKEVADAIAAGNSTDAALLAAINNRALIDHTHDGMGSSGGPLTGSGFPEGVVAAPVGRTYVDEDETAGASVWLKTTGGDGATGWIVIAGDTGWRDVTSVLRAQWGGDLYYNAIIMKRLPTRVLFQIEGESYTNNVYSLPLGPEWGAVGDISPSGIYKAARFPLQATTGGQSGQVSVRTDGALALHGTQFGLCSQVSWDSNPAAWPAANTLPGSIWTP